MNSAIILQRPVRYAGDAGDYYADRLIIVNGVTIGVTWYCPADYIPARKRWASYGPAGLSMLHGNRRDAEAVQVNAR